MIRRLHTPHQTRRRIVAGILAALMATAGVVATGATRAEAGGPTLVPLIAFHSPSRGDHFTTTQQTWTCQHFGTIEQRGRPLRKGTERPPR